MAVDTSAIKEDQKYQNWRTMDVYKLLRDLYTGMGIIGNTDGKGSGLVPNSSELYYNTRGQLTPEVPWFRLYLDALYEPLYMEQPPIPTISDTYEPFLSNVNRGGMSMVEYMQEVTLYSLMDGEDFMASGYDGDPDLYPWFHYYMAPQYNCDLSEVDVFGAVKMYVFTNKKVDDEEAEYYEHNVYTNAIGDTKGTYQEYRSEEEDSLGEKVGEETPSYDIRPIYSQRREQGKVLVTPKNRSIAGLCVSIYNSESDQRWVLRVQGHSIFVITSDVAPSGFGDGLTQGLRIDVTENQGGAEFVAPPAELSKEQRESKAEILAQLFELMRHGGVIAQRSSQIPESGASKAFTFRPVNTVMGKAQAMGEQVIKYVNDAVSFYKGIELELSYKFKENFTPMAGLEVADIIAILIEFKELGLPEGVLASLKQLAVTLGAGDELMDEIDNFKLDTALIQVAEPIE